MNLSFINRQIKRETKSFIKSNSMKIFSIFWCVQLFLITISCKAQKKADSATVSYMLESVKAIKTFAGNELFYMNFGKIIYNEKHYTVYTFGFNPVYHQPYLYILFYECFGCQNTVLGRKDLLTDILDLNLVYTNSKNFSKSIYMELFNDLKNNYMPEKGGNIINREDYIKMQQ